MGNVRLTQIGIDEELCGWNGSALQHIPPHQQIPREVTIEIEHLCAESKNGNEEQGKENVLYPWKKPEPEVGSHEEGLLSEFGVQNTQELDKAIANPHLTSVLGT